MLTVETIGRIRREFFVKGKTIKEIARDLRLSRNTVRKVVRSQATSFEYERSVQPLPRLGAWTATLDGMLMENALKPTRERLTVIRIFEALRDLGYEGGYDAVRRYAKRWRSRQVSGTVDAHVPLIFAPGEAYQFDWSHEIVVLNGTTTMVKAAHLRLCHSRMMFVRAYPRESQEMVFDAHDRGFAFFRGACTRGIYDNMKTAVDAVFVGKERRFNRRFLQMCGHYLVEPTACTPAAVSKTCLVRFDNNKYSVPARAVGRPVEIQAYADRIMVRQDGEVVAEHARRFGRDQTVYDPWHYVPVLARKPGALRNGAPFRDWVLPGALGRVRARLAAAADGDRQMVDILSAVLTDGLAAVEAACGEALRDGVQSSAVILNILARRREAVAPEPVLTPAALRLQHEPAADCARYDSLRRSPDGTP